MTEFTQDDLRARKKIYGLDLKTIVKVTRKGEKWKPKRAADAEHWYKNFLWMCYLNRRRPVAVLGSDADRIWHNHILDTARYQKDCNDIFGRYLDHRPIFGRPTRAQQAAIAETQEQCMALFGEVAPDSIWPCLYHLL